MLVRIPLFDENSRWRIQKKALYGIAHKCTFILFYLAFYWAVIEFPNGSSVPWQPTGPFLSAHYPILALSAAHASSLQENHYTLFTSNEALRLPFKVDALSRHGLNYAENPPPILERDNGDWKTGVQTKPLCNYLINYILRPDDTRPSFRCYSLKLRAS